MIEQEGYQAEIERITLLVRRNRVGNWSGEIRLDSGGAIYCGGTNLLEETRALVLQRTRDFLEDVRGIHLDQHAPVEWRPLLDCRPR